MTATNIIRCSTDDEIVTLQQCYVSESGDSEIVDCYQHESVHLCRSTNPFATLQTYPRKDIGVIARSYNHLNALESLGFSLSLGLNLTVDDSNKLNKSPTNRSSVHRHAHKKKLNSSLPVKIILPIVSFAVLLLVLYFFYRARQRNQENSRKQDEGNNMSAMEMGDMGGREGQNQGTTKAPTTTPMIPMGNLSRQISTASSTFTHPRQAPFPPPDSPPPDRPLPPLPAWVPRNAPLSTAGRGRDTEALPRWPPIDGADVSPSTGSGSSGSRYTHR
ncbi:hypothetical protein F5Y09DRAFT_352132 [Xylaria sp. FL1042]|nr:hypothetical protein F5Y09DRAFT_352132 [Xylaria sp. FL1042]